MKIQAYFITNHKNSRIPQYKTMNIQEYHNIKPTKIQEYHNTKPPNVIESHNIKPRIFKMTTIQKQENSRIPQNKTKKIQQKLRYNVEQNSTKKLRLMHRR